MIDNSEYFAFLKSEGLWDIANVLEDVVSQYYTDLSHGDLDRWLDAVESMPEIIPSRITLDADAVIVGSADDIDESQSVKLTTELMKLHPWRKGPFDLFGVYIDSEWRSDIKWARLVGSIDLKGKCVLDVGCGNGYYMLRMLGAGAKAVVGIDPTMLFVVQFAAINKYVRTNAAAVLPLKLEDIPQMRECQDCFDTVFSMGILYHRRDPAEHISQLLGFLKPGGQIVLETIVLDKRGKENFVPQDRYGKMRNVWNIPTVDLLCDWLRDAGCENIQVVAMERTTSEEQRKTEWMTFESLDDFLDRGNPKKTIEGYPAPVRAVIIANSGK